MFIPLEKNCIFVPYRFEVTQKLHVILLTLVYDLGKVSRGREMNGEINYASLVRSTGFEQINVLSSKFIIQVFAWSKVR